ncbi:MAG: ferrous iron transporter B, partial [Bdellovibrionales bacterium]|nr:ferrous iron transporter B [Bdellovibrionales bacterium]
ENEVGLVLGVLDATRLERSLTLGLEAKYRAQQAGKRFLFVLNMMDEIQISGTEIDVEGLSKALGCPVMPVSARTGMGLDDLRKKVDEMFSLEPVSTPLLEGENPSWQKQARELQKDYGAHAAVLLKTQNKLDRIFLGHVWGGLLFLAIMALVFQSIFNWAVPFMDLTETVISELALLVRSALPEGFMADFVKDAVFGGFGSFLVFVPQIFILTFIVGILEDSGYLARAAIICHRPLSFFGLSGKSFLPLLSGHACAIPAIFAARTMESPRKRLLTIVAIPMMACSARLPVYTLLVAAIIPPITFGGGLLGLQGLAFLSLYLFGIFMGLLLSGLISRVKYPKKDVEPFLLELPPYRMPHWKPLLLRSYSSSVSFIKKAGPVIFAVTFVVWFLGYFPHGPEHLETSYLATLGHWIEPLFKSIGLDWMVGVAVITSVIAREVFVGTLGTLFGIQGAEENIADLAHNLQASGLTFASGMALLVFYALALQCVSTLAVIRKETGSLKLPSLMFVGYTILAFVFSFVVYQVLHLLM